MAKYGSGILKWIGGEFMAFKNMFKNSNDTNEKSVVGFAAFIIMAVYCIMDMVTAYLGKPFTINETIFSAVVLIILGAFGIAVVDKIFTPKNNKPGTTSTTDTTTTTNTSDTINTPDTK